MNSKRIFVIGVTAAMSMASFYANATAGHVGLEACASALAGKLSDTNGTPVGYRLENESDIFDKQLLNREIISLYARDPSNDVLVSRVDCFVDQHGHVLRLKDMPLEDDMDKRVTKAD